MAVQALSDRSFDQLSSLIHEKWGLKMPPNKRSLIYSRLFRRLAILSLDSFEDYCDYVMSPRGQETELLHLIDAVSTNKTEFFREPAALTHFLEFALPDILNNWEAKREKRLQIFCAGCSSGEEPYTLSMLIDDYLTKSHTHRSFDFHVLGGDVSVTALKKAKRAVYPHDRVDPVPMDFRRKYLLKSKKKDDDLVRMSPAMRARVGFFWVNLVEDFALDQLQDVVFCRNVIIYFNKETQRQVLLQLSSLLQPEGYLYLGHSETITGLDLPLVPVSPTVYRKTC